MYSILIVEDEPIIRRGIASLIDFESLGISTVQEVENGEQALEKIREEAPDILLTDINMPKMDGITLAQLVRTEYPQMRIIFLTGYDYVDYLLSAVKIGVEDYILKPISKSDVSEIIVKLVSSLQKERKDKEIEKVLEKITTVDTQDNIAKNNYKELIQNIIEESYTDSQFTLSVLSEKLDLSSGYLSIMFKKNFGIPFQDYLLQKRMEKAKLLLLTTELKNYEIAEQIGFEDVNYFITKFKKYYQITPKQYREMVLKNENE